MKGGALSERLAKARAALEALPKERTVEAFYAWIAAREPSIRRHFPPGCLLTNKAGARFILQHDGRLRPARPEET